jgi:hypothetical protein
MDLQPTLTYYEDQRLLVTLRRCHASLIGIMKAMITTQ